MVKLVFLVSFLAILPLTFSLPHALPLGHVQSTFDLNCHSNSKPFLENLRLIQTRDDRLPLWMTEEEVLELIRSDIKFMDVTDYMDLGTRYKTFSTRQYPVEPSFTEEVKPFIGNLTTKYMQQNLEKFTSFHNRYYRSSYGAASSDWLYDQILKIITDSNSASDVTVEKYSHTWSQNSIIARFKGHDSDKDNEVVIVGAHQDSINMWMPSIGRAPGADDDGSGTVTILEAFRVLVQGKFRPRRPVEFHWYSAEEAGLLGSQAIATAYEKDGREVIAMIQNDMTGYVGRNPESIGIVVDWVSSELTTFVKKLVVTYAGIPYRDTKCGYACSDHASWQKAGYPSAFTIEGEFSDSNPHIHSTGDTIDKLSFDHMLEFSKISVSFAIELSHI